MSDYMIEFLHGCADKYVDTVRIVKDVEDLRELGYGDKDRIKIARLDVYGSCVIVDEDMGCTCIQRVTRLN